MFQRIHPSVSLAVLAGEYIATQAAAMTLAEPQFAWRPDPEAPQPAQRALVVRFYAAVQLPNGTVLRTSQNMPADVDVGSLFPALGLTEQQQPT